MEKNYHSKNYTQKAFNNARQLRKKENTTEADASSAAASAEGYRAYQVKTGDTISSISQTYYGNMSMVDEICSLNHIEEQDLIYTGQILLLP